jgi:hypothetical protein
MRNPGLVAGFVGIGEPGFECMFDEAHVGKICSRLDCGPVERDTPPPFKGIRNTILF